MNLCSYFMIILNWILLRHLKFVSGMKRIKKPEIYTQCFYFLNSFILRLFLGFQKNSTVKYGTSLSDVLENKRFLHIMCKNYHIAIYLLNTN